MKCGPFREQGARQGMVVGRFTVHSNQLFSADDGALASILRYYSTWKAVDNLFKKFRHDRIKYL